MIQIDAEIILPSGRFASIRKPTFGDFLKVGDPDDAMRFMLGLCAQCVRIDDEPLSFAQWEAMPLDEAMPILSALSDMLDQKYTAPRRHRGN